MDGSRGEKLAFDYLGLPIIGIINKNIYPLQIRLNNSKFINHDKLILIYCEHKCVYL